MPGKHDASVDSRQPLAEKLSNIFIRPGSTKNKKAPVPTSEKRSIFRLTRKNEPARPITPMKFKPLEVDLSTPGTIRLSDAWLPSDAQYPNKKQKQYPQPPYPQPHRAPDWSKAPIAELFANKSTLDILITKEPSRSNSQNHGDKSVNRPISMVEPFFKVGTPSVIHQPTLADEAQNTLPDAQVTESILNRGRPIESRYSTAYPPPKQTKVAPQSLSESEPPIAIETKKVAVVSESAPSQNSLSVIISSPTTNKPDVLSENSPVMPSGSIKRDSKFEPVTISLNSTAIKATSADVPKIEPTTQLHRIQAWQKSIPLASPATAPTSPISASPALPLSATSQVRKVSPRGVTNDRLSWIKQLERKKTPGVNQDLGFKKHLTGSVSDKLAMFENKASASAPLRLQPRTRSNSIASRFSSAGFDSTFSANSNLGTATPRTSIDTERSNKRASSVMNYYDDSFREKMESLVGGGSYAPNTDKSNLPEKTRLDM